MVSNFFKKKVAFKRGIIARITLVPLKSYNTSMLHQATYVLIPFCPAEVYRFQTFFLLINLVLLAPSLDISP